MDKPVISGIYQIVNLVNGKFYIGSSKNIYDRWEGHISLLNKNKHYNPYLQGSWKKYGEENFQFIILEENIYGQQQLWNAERKWIGLLSPQYNIGPVGGGDTLSNHPNKEQILLKQKEMFKNFTAEEKEKFRLSRCRGENHPCWDGGLSKYKCIDCGSQLSNKNPIRCRKCASKIVGGNKKGKPQISSRTRKVEINDCIYESAVEASKILNINVSTIRARLAAEKAGYSYIDKRSSSKRVLCPVCHKILPNVKAKICRNCSINKPRKIEIDGQVFHSIYEATKLTGMSKSKIIYRLKTNQPGYKYLDQEPPCET